MFVRFKSDLLTDFIIKLHGIYITRSQCNYTIINSIFNQRCLFVWHRQLIKVQFTIKRPGWPIKTVNNCLCIVYFRSFGLAMQVNHSNHSSSLSGCHLNQIYIPGTHQSGAEILVRKSRLRSHSESGNSSMDEKEIERLQVSQIVFKIFG